MAKAYREGDTWSIRQGMGSERPYLSGFATKKSAEQEANRRAQQYLEGKLPKGPGPDRATLGRALQLYGLERLKFLKGADQEARLINKYLRAGGFDTLVVKRNADPSAHKVMAMVAYYVGAKHKPGLPSGQSGDLFSVELEPHTDARKYARGEKIKQHREKQHAAREVSEKLRAALAKEKFGAVQRHQLQKLMDALSTEGSSPATVGLERAMLRAVFNHARNSWYWPVPTDNPAAGLRMPKVDNARERVMSLEEQNRLDEALSTCHNALVKPVTDLLRETAMRASEPLQGACWGDVDWKNCVLHLRDAKAGGREVPLSPGALAALRELKPGAADEPNVRISYESLRAAWQRACERAGIENLRIQDLRHTSATRFALATGNMFLVKALTGHKTLKMVERYVNVNARDAVAAMHAPAPTVELQAVPQWTQQMVQDALVEAMRSVGGTVNLPVREVQTLRPAVNEAGQLRNQG